MGTRFCNLHRDATWLHLRQTSSRLNNKTILPSQFNILNSKLFSSAMSDTATSTADMIAWILVSPFSLSRISGAWAYSPLHLVPRAPYLLSCLSIALPQTGPRPKSFPWPKAAPKVVHMRLSEKCASLQGLQPTDNDLYWYTIFVTSTETPLSSIFDRHRIRSTAIKLLLQSNLLTPGLFEMVVKSEQRRRRHQLPQG